MLLEKTNWFWKAGLIEKNKKALFVAMIMLILPIMTGCSDETPEVSDIEITQQDSEVYSFANNDSASTERIEEILSDIYEEAVVTNTLGSLDIMRRMVARLGENGYVAVDSWNQIDMVQAEQAIDFCKAVDEKEMDILTHRNIRCFGFCLWMKSAGNITESIFCRLVIGKTTCFFVIGARMILGIWTFTIYLTGSIQ